LPSRFFFFPAIIQLAQHKLSADFLFCFFEGSLPDPQEAHRQARAPLCQREAAPVLHPKVQKVPARRGAYIYI